MVPEDAQSGDTLVVTATATDRAGNTAIASRGVRVASAGVVVGQVLDDTTSLPLAGATVLKGVLGYGATDHIRTTKILDLSADLSMVVEIVDEEGKIEAFQPILSGLIEEANSGGLVTLENIRVIHYLPEKS